MASVPSMHYVGPGDGPVLHVLDETVRVVLDPDETDGELFAFTSLVPDGFGPGLHTHASREIFLVVEGTVEFRTIHDGKIVKYAAGPGSSVHVPPEVPHGYTARGGAVRLYTTFTPGKQMHAFFLALDALRTQFPTGLAARDPAFQAALRTVAEQHGLRRFPDPDR